MWNTIQIQLCNDELWPGQGLSVYAHCDLDLGDVTLCQFHDTPLGHGQQLSEILRYPDPWPGHGFLVCAHCDLDLGDMTLC